MTRAASVAVSERSMPSTGAGTCALCGARTPREHHCHGCSRFICWRCDDDVQPEGKHEVKDHRRVKMSEPAKKAVRRQCAKCPWRVDVDPHDIPGGYSEQLHAGLSKTIAEPGDLRGTRGHQMACHETPAGKEQPCVGWVIHQLGPGNNIALRMQAMDGRFAHFQTVGPQHQRFEDTLPKRRRRRAGGRR